MAHRRTRFDDHRRTASRRPGIIPGRRLAFALAFAGAWALGAGLATGAQADGGSTPVLARLTVFAPGVASWNLPVPLTVATMGQQACPVFSGLTDVTLDGQNFQLPPQTWSLSTVLTCGFNASLAPGDYVEVQNGEGAWEAPLAFPADLATPSSFDPSTQLPVVYFDGTNPGYYRPPRSAADQNAADRVADGEPISILVDEGGPPLAVAITQSPSSEPVPTGTTVSLTANAASTQGAQLDPSKLSYSWSIAGGASIESGATSPTASATFATPGTYSVTVEVADADGSGGAATTTITVGTAQAATSGTPSPGNGVTPQPTLPPTGPQLSTGATGVPRVAKPHAHRKTGGGSSPAPAADKPHTLPTSSPAPASKHAPTPKQPTETPAVHGTATTAVQPTAVQHPSISKHKPTVHAGATGGAPSTHTLRPVRVARHPTPAVRRSPPPAATVTSKAPLVRGRLISAVAPLPGSASPLVYSVVSAAAKPAPVRRGGAASPLAALAAALAAILLLGLGAARELRWRVGRRAVHARS